MECGKNNGVCSCIEGYAGVKCHKCMPNVIGDKCDTCEPGFFGYPSCQEGLSIIRSLSLYRIVALNIIYFEQMKRYWLPLAFPLIMELTRKLLMLKTPISAVPTLSNSL